MVETATEFAKRFFWGPNPVGGKIYEHLAQMASSRDAAIARQVASELIDKFSQASGESAFTDDLRRKYGVDKEAKMDRSVSPGTFVRDVLVIGGVAVPKTNLAEHDAAIAHAAKVEVLRDAYQAWLSNPSTSARERQSDISRQYWDGIAARHNITAAELEPPKPEIKVEQSPFNRDCRQITHGHFFWNGATWVDDEADAINYTPHDAEAIAAKLRADGNYPGGGK